MGNLEIGNAGFGSFPQWSTLPLEILISISHYYYALDYRDSIPRRGKDFSLRRYVQTVSRLTLLFKEYQDLFRLMHRYRLYAALIPRSHTPSWRGV
jgi:hypothetical protein